MERTKVAFFGSSKYSLAYLEQIVSIGYDIKLVVSQPDKPVGRGLAVLPTPVKIWAKEHGVLVLTPSNLSDPMFLGTLGTLPLEIGISSYYGLLIPAQVINHFKKGILNVHHSLLPKHRGSNPIPWTILSGEKETGTTIIKIGEKFDGGLVVSQSKQEVEDTDNSQTLREKLDAKALMLLKVTLPKYLTDEVPLKKQNLKDGNYDPRVTKDMAKIDWSKSDFEIERAIRAFTPWPGAWSTVGETLSHKEIRSQKSAKDGNNRLKILKAHLIDGKLGIDEIQMEGKNPVGWKQFLAGYSK